MLGIRGAINKVKGMPERIMLVRNQGGKLREPAAHDMPKKMIAKRDITITFSDLLLQWLGRESASTQ